MSAAGPKGPIVLSDTHLIDKLAHFDRERIPERVVHAKGAGIHISTVFYGVVSAATPANPVTAVFAMALWCEEC